MFKLGSPLLVLMGLALGGCAQRPHSLPPEPPAQPQLAISDSRAWSYMSVPGQEVVTPHYRIFTTHTDQRFVEHLPGFLEGAFGYYQQLIKPTNKPDRQMEVYLFGQREQWDRFTSESTGNAATIYRKIQEGGYVDGGRAVFYDIHALKTFAVAGHECFHQYIWHYTKHRPPAWLDEGLACYFESFQWDGQTLKLEPRQNTLRLNALRFGLTEKTLLSMSELLSTHPGNVIGGTPGKVSSYYAQLWALILFLRGDPNYQAQFSRLLADVGSQRMIELAGEEGYKGNAEDFGPAVFRAYISKDSSKFHAQFMSFCIRLAGF